MVVVVATRHLVAILCNASRFAALKGLLRKELLPALNAWDKNIFILLCSLHFSREQSVVLGGLVREKSFRLAYFHVPT